MQTLPITSASPVTSTQAPSSSNSSDGSTDTTAAEPFGSVLARQCSNSGTQQDSKKTSSKQSSSSAANDANADATPSTTSNQLAQAPAPDASTLAASMLAALLPAPVITTPNSASLTKDSANLPGSITISSTISSDSDSASDLPSDMLAMMLPASTGTNLTPANGKGLKNSATAGDKTLSLPISTTALSNTLQTSDSNVTADPTKTTDVTNIAGAIGGIETTSATDDKTTAIDATKMLGTASTVSVANANTIKENSFATALQTASKDSANSILVDRDNIKNQSVQPVAPSTVDSAAQNANVPIVASQSETVQSVQTSINTPVSDKAWGSEFNQKITWMATQHQQTAELHLNPPNLGPLDVVLKVSGDQATALFTSTHAEVRDVVQQALPQLREMLANNGITLGNAMVSDQSPKDQQAWQASQQQKGNKGTSGTVDSTSGIGSISSTAATSTASRHQGMVDTFA